jgi:hypothetical protein
VSNGVFPIDNSVSGLKILDLQFLQNDFNPKGDVLLILTDNNELRKYSVETLFDVRANPTFMHSSDITQFNEYPSGANATTFQVFDKEKFDGFGKGILVGFDNGEIYQWGLEQNLVDVSGFSKQLSVGGNPVDLEQRIIPLPGIGELLLVVTDNNEIEEYSFDGDISNSSLNGVATASEDSNMVAVHLVRTAGLQRLLADGRIFENQYQPGASGQPNIGPNQFGNTNPVFQSSVASPSSLELGGRPLKDQSPYFVTDSTNTDVEQISTRRGGWQDIDEYKTQFHPDNS